MRTIFLSNGTIRMPLKKRSSRRHLSSSKELSDELWLEILLKLPVMTLHICKCVSKTWCLLVSEVLDALKNAQSPMYGLVFQQATFVHYVMVGKPYSSFLPLIDREIGLVRFKSRIAAKVNVKTLDEEDRRLSLDFEGLCGDYDGFTTWHKGLLLATDGITYNVFNPATREVLSLASPPKLEFLLQPPESVENERCAAIINLSDSRSPLCSFRVVRFSGLRKFVEVYYSEDCKWISCRHNLKPHVLRDGWRLNNTVYLKETLFFLTGCNEAVAVKFGGSGRRIGKELHVYGLPLPSGQCNSGFTHSILGESQGSLYLCFSCSSLFSHLRIWKHNGDFLSASADSWTLIFRFSNQPWALRAPQLCSPMIERHLSVAKAAIGKPKLIAFHPDCAIVYLFERPHIFAINLIDDTVEEVLKLEDKECLLDNGFCRQYFASPYQPCFASLKQHGKQVVYHTV